MNTQQSTVSLQSLQSLWDDIVRAHPELRDIAWQSEGDEAMQMQFMPGPPPCLSFPADAPLALFASLLVSRPHSCALVAEALGIDVSRLTPVVLRAYIFLHECGHALDFLTHFASFPHGQEASSSQLRFVDACMRANERQEYELRHLPIPVTPSGFLAARREYPEYLFELVRTHLGIAAPTEADLDRVFLDLEKAYKALPSEQEADRFALQYFRSHPTLLAA